MATTARGSQVLVAKPGPVGAGYLDEHVEIARVGAPGGNLHPAQGEGVDLYREGPGLLVGEPVDEQVGVELSKRRCSCFEVGGRSADDGVRVGGQALGTVRSGGNSTDQQVIHVVAVERLNNTTDVEWSRPAHPSGVCAARSRASSSRNASTFSLESSRVPSEVIDTSSVPRWPGVLVDPFLQLLDGLDGHSHALSVLGGGASLVYGPAACPSTQRRIVRGSANRVHPARQPKVSPPSAVALPASDKARVYEAAAKSSRLWHTCGGPSPAEENAAGRVQAGTARAVRPGASGPLAAVAGCRLGPGTARRSPRGTRARR